MLERTERRAPAGADWVSAGWGADGAPELELGLEHGADRAACSGADEHTEADGATVGAGIDVNDDVVESETEGDVDVVQPDGAGPDNDDIDG